MKGRADSSSKTEQYVRSFIAVASKQDECSVGLVV